MVQLEVQEVAGIFRGELGWMFAPYPALIPDHDWPSLGILDALCQGLRGREDWSEGEKLFVVGAAAQMGELVHECWSQFATDVRVEYDDGIVCSATGTDGASYRLELEKSLVRVLQDPDILPPLNGVLAHPPKGPVIELFGLSACLGASAMGEGAWTSVGPEELTERVDAVLPQLAESAASYYARLNPDEGLGQKTDLYCRALIWPPAGADPKRPFKTAAWGLLGYLDDHYASQSDARPLLRNLVRFPCRTVHGAALICWVLDETRRTSGELVELASDLFREQAPLHRATAIELAAKLGRNIDWRAGGENPAARFRFERRIGLLPLVYLPYDFCADPENAELVDALIAADPEPAMRLVERRLRVDDESPELLFQQAMLKRELGDPEAAESLLTDVVRNHPEKLDGTFYCEAGRSALQLGRVDDAITRLERALELGGDYRVELNLGRAYAQAGRTQDAIEILGEAVSRGHLPSYALVERAELRRAVGREEGYFRDVAASAALYPFGRHVVEKVMSYYVTA